MITKREEEEEEEEEEVVYILLYYNIHRIRTAPSPNDTASLSLIF